MYATRSVRALAIGAVAIVAIACGSDSITGASSVEGTYSLRTVNGVALPFTITDSSGGVVLKLTLMSPSSVTLNADHSFRIISTARLVLGGDDWGTETDTTTGTYALSGHQLTFSRPGFTEAPTADWNGSDMLTAAENGSVFIYRK